MDRAAIELARPGSWSGARLASLRSSGFAAALLLALGCFAPRANEPSLRIHDPEPAGPDMVAPVRLSGSMPDLAPFFLPGVKTVACTVAATVTAEGALIDLSWEEAAEVAPGFRAEIERAMADWKFRPASYLGHTVSVPTRFALDRCPLALRPPA